MNYNQLSCPILIVWALILSIAAAANAAPIAYLVADANGDPYGQVPGTGQVVAFDASGAYVGPVITGLTVPSALTIGPNGYLYIANHNTGPNNGQVLVYDPNNNYTRVDNGTTIINGVFASGLNGPGGLLSDGSTLFVSELGDIGVFQGELIKHYDAAGTLINELNNPLGAGSGQTGRTGMAFDASGSLYVGAFLTGQDGGEVLKFDHIVASTAYSNTPSIFAFGTAGASGLLFHDGHLFVAAQFLGSVVEFDGSGNYVGPLSIPTLAFPSGLHNLQNGDLLITEIGDGSTPGQIDLYNFGTGSFSSGFITGTGVDGSVFQPTAVISVPEPTAAVLAAAGFAMLMGAKMLRRRVTL